MDQRATASRQDDRRTLSQAIPQNIGSVVYHVDQIAKAGIWAPKSKKVTNLVIVVTENVLKSDGGTEGHLISQGIHLLDQPLVCLADNLKTDISSPAFREKALLYGANLGQPIHTEVEKFHDIRTPGIWVERNTKVPYLLRENAFNDEGHPMIEIGACRGRVYILMSLNTDFQEFAMFERKLGASA